jgi:Pretoxin HINT domain
VARRVLDVIVGHGTKRLVRLKVGGRTLTTTVGHPFWVQDRGAWIAAEELGVGDLLREPAGQLERVQKLRLVTLADQRVYNLTVAGVHTYHAGAAFVLVHNCTDAVEVTSRAARRQAMRDRGIPTSQQPSAQRASGPYRQYDYDMPTSMTGRRREVVTRHPADADHPKPHWEAAADRGDWNRYGLRRYATAKARQLYDRP